MTPIKYLFSLLTFSLFLSCDSHDANEETNCFLNSANGIEKLETDGIADPDSITIKFDNLEFKLRGVSYSVASEFYDYDLDRRTVQFANENDQNVTCKIKLYYPGDSSFFNNNEYLTTFGTGDFTESETLEGDSLIFYKQCSFRLFMELQTQSGQIFRTIAHEPDQTNFYSIDSIKYVERVFDYAQFQVFGHFEVTLFDNMISQNKRVSARLVTLIETDK